MNIYYQDEYGEEIYGSNSTSIMIPHPGDTIIIDDDDWKAVSRTFYPQHNSVVVSITQNQVKPKAPTEDGDRLKEMERAIVDVNKRQGLQEKRTKSLREQAMSVRKHIRQNQPKPKDTQ
jgi:hypothetical protein